MQTDEIIQLDAIVDLSEYSQGDGRTIRGIAVPYDQESPYIKERFAQESVVMNDTVPLLMGHDHNAPVGLVTRGWHESDGFHFEARISDTSQGKDAATLARDGVLRLSVGAIPKLIGRSTDGVNEIQRAELKEISLVTMPAYTQTRITQVRHAVEIPEPEILAEVPVKGENMEEISNVVETTSVLPDLAEVREDIQEIQRSLAGLQKNVVPAMDTRSAGEFLKAICDGDNSAISLIERAYTGATTADTVTTPIDVNLVRIVEEANPLGAVFGRGVTPPTGMSITFAKVDAITDNTGEQAAEGDDLGYVQLNVVEDSVNIKTVGNYSELSRQAIDRATIQYLDNVLSIQAVKLGAALALELRTAYQTVAADQVTAGNTVTVATADYAGWVGALADAQALYFQPSGARIDALIVSTDIFKGLLALDGSPVITFSGETPGFAGSGNPGGLRGSLAGIPIIVDAGIADADSAFVSSLALRQYTSGAIRLSQDNAVNLTSAFGLATYTCVADEFPNLIIPVVLD